MTFIIMIMIKNDHIFSNVLLNVVQECFDWFCSVLATPSAKINEMLCNY